MVITWSTGEGNGKPLQYSCLENPMNSMKRQTDRTLKDELPRSVGAQYATGDQWRNNSRNDEGMEPKQKEYPPVDVTGDRSKVRCCKEQYCIGTWTVRSMNQGKLELPYHPAIPLPDIHPEKTIIQKTHVPFSQLGVISTGNMPL